MNVQAGHGAAKGLVVAGGGREVRTVHTDEVGQPLGRLHGLSGPVHGVVLYPTWQSLAVVCADAVLMVDMHMRSLPKNKEQRQPLLWNK